MAFIGENRLSQIFQLIKNTFASKDEVVSGVKGDEESSYRTGNVNLTSENIGALSESDYLGGITWDVLASKFTWDDLAGTQSSGTVTENLGLSKPGRLSTNDFNGNMDILDTAVAGKQDAIEVLPVSKGGTGQNTLGKARTSLGSMQTPVCSTAANVAAKVATLVGFSLFAGARIMVNTMYGNTVEGAITLNVNDTGDVDVYFGGTATSASNPALWSANNCCEFIYDGLHWHYLGSAKDGYPDFDANQAITDISAAIGNTALLSNTVCQDIKTLRDSVSWSTNNTQVTSSSVVVASNDYWNLYIVIQSTSFIVCGIEGTNAWCPISGFCITDKTESTTTLRVFGVNASTATKTQSVKIQYKEL